MNYLAIRIRPGLRLQFLLMFSW